MNEATILKELTNAVINGEEDKVNSSLRNFLQKIE